MTRREACTLLYIDTDVAIDMIHKAVDLDEIKNVTDKNERIAITAPLMMELYYGLHAMEYNKKFKVSNEKIKKERFAIGKLKDATYQVPFDVDAAELSAKIFHELASTGQKIEVNDCMIAATILTRGDGLLLKRIAGLNIISLKKSNVKELAP
jgi:predicted nucleic acid-binding protein